MIHMLDLMSQFVFVDFSSLDHLGRHDLQRPQYNVGVTKILTYLFLDSNLIAGFSLHVEYFYATIDRTFEALRKIIVNDIP